MSKSQIYYIYEYWVVKVKTLGRDPLASGLPFGFVDVSYKRCLDKDYRFFYRSWIYVSPSRHGRIAHDSWFSFLLLDIVVVLRRALYVAHCCCLVGL